MQPSTRRKRWPAVSKPLLLVPESFPELPIHLSTIGEEGEDSTSSDGSSDGSPSPKKQRTGDTVGMYNIIEYNRM